MNMRRFILPVLAGLGLTALGLIGCESKISFQRPPIIVPEQVVPATEIEVWLTADAGETVQNTKVDLYRGGSVLESVTVTATGTTDTVVFDELSVGSYEVRITGPNQFYQSKSVRIETNLVPIASFVLKFLKDSQTIEVEQQTVTDPTATTVIEVEQPQGVENVVEGIAKTEVKLTGVSTGTNVTVANTTGAEVPPSANTGIAGAVQINVTTEQKDAQVEISLPVPVSADQLANAVGGFVDILSFDFATSTWKNLGQGQIGSDGKVTTTVKGLGTENLIAIGTTPSLGTLIQQIAVTRTLDPAQLELLKAQGESTVGYDLQPDVTQGGGKITTWTAPLQKGAGVIPAPSGVNPVDWGLAAPIIAQKEADLASWILGGDTYREVSIPAETSVYNQERKRATFNFNFNYGGAARAFTLTVEFNKGTVTLIYHDSGFGSSG